MTPSSDAGFVAEIAALFAFLASDEASYLPGHPVIIDGGEFAGGLASRYLKQIAPVRR